MKSTTVSLDVQKLIGLLSRSCELQPPGASLQAERWDDYLVVMIYIPGCPDPVRTAHYIDRDNLLQDWRLVIAAPDDVAAEGEVSVESIETGIAYINDKLRDVSWHLQPAPVHSVLFNADRRKRRQYLQEVGDVSANFYLVIPALGLRMMTNPIPLKCVYHPQELEQIVFASMK